MALQDAMNKKFSETKLKLTELYNKYRAYYGCKADAKPLSLFYRLLPNPKLMTHSDFASKPLPMWLPLYRIEKILTNLLNSFRLKCQKHQLRRRNVDLAKEW